MFCGYCGKEIPDESMFCSYCGQQIFNDIDGNKSDDILAEKSNGDVHRTLPDTHPYQVMGGWLAVFTYAWLILGIYFIICIILELVSFVAVTSTTAGFMNGLIGKVTGPLALLVVLYYAVCAALSFNLYSKMKDKETDFLHFYESLFILSLLVGIVGSFIPYITSPTLLKYLGSNLPQIFISFLKTIVWPTVGFVLTMLYFSKSVRVRTYFGTDKYLRKSRFLASTPSPVSMVEDEKPKKEMDNIDSAVLQDSIENRGRGIILGTVLAIIILIVVLITNTIANGSTKFGIAGSIRFKDEVNDALYYGMGSTYEELQARYRDIKTDYRAGLWYAESPSMAFKYAYSPDKDMKLDSTMHPTFIEGNLGDMFDGLNEEISMEEFVKRLEGDEGGKYSEEEGQTWHHISEYYFVTYLDCKKLHRSLPQEGSSYAARLSIAYEKGKNTVSPKSYSRLEVVAG